MRKDQLINWYIVNDGAMPNGDPTVFAFPCRFPAAPSVRPENWVQDVDHKSFSGAGEPREYFFPEFPGAAGKERGRR
jgi:hypothetical protein